MSQPVRAESTASFATAHNATPRRAGAGPIQLLLDLFSSVWLGVTLLAVLFIYSSIGSAGAPIGEGMLRPWFLLNPDAWINIRQLPMFEMTEFEWFHWWPFKLLIALICVNIIVATIRRVPFNALNLGVWMIHGGIIVLTLGSVWYFGTKVEGDAPVNRRRIVAKAPGMDQPESMVALPGNMMVIGTGNDQYRLQVSDIDPQWELLSGDDKGKKAYKISVRVEYKGGMFIRELIAGRPEYTQDIVRNTDPNAQGQPFVRAIKAIGKPLVDEALQLSLDYDPQLYFYLADSRAVYLRELDAAGQPTGDWIQRPIHDLPRYNDYVASRDDVWTAPGDSLQPRLIDVAVPPVAANDPLPDVTLRVNRYLRYAFLDSRRRPVPDGKLDPAVNVRLQSSAGESQQYQLNAFDPNSNSALQGTLFFTWVDSAAALDRLKTRVDPTLRFTVPGSNVTVEKSVTSTSSADPNLPFTPIEGTEYSYRVQSLQQLPDMHVSLAILEIKTPQRSFMRWVCDDSTKTRDMAMAEGLSQHGADIPLDENLVTEYKPGSFPPPIVVAAGPGENDLSVIITKAIGQPAVFPVAIGQAIPVTDAVSLTVDKYAARTVQETKPFVVPREQRDRDVRENMTMIKVDVPTRDGVVSAWLPYHMFAFASPEEVLRRFPYRPQTISLPDGRRIEMMFSRERLPLPAPVALDEFKVAPHVGGFTGETASIMDWISSITFATPSGWTEPVSVSMNKPKEFHGYWYFQAQWDPPDRPRFEGDPPSRGLNYTVLGVGNRNGVGVQLAGCIIAVLGMMHTFYLRPILKRRRQQAVYAQVGTRNTPSRAEQPLVEPVNAAWKVES